MLRTLTSSVALLAGLLAGCSDGDDDSSGPTGRTDASEPTSSSATPVPEAATAPVDPCSLVRRETWLRALQPQHVPDARLMRTLARDDDRITAECSVDIGRFPDPGVVVWGYVLNDWTIASEARHYGASAMQDPPPEVADRGGRAYGWSSSSSSGASAEVNGQVVYAQIVDKVPVKEPQRASTELPAALLDDIAARTLAGMDAFPVDLPDDCPAAGSRAVQALIGDVAFARGYADYGNAECQYVGARPSQYVALRARSHTDLYWEVDQGLAGSLDVGDQPPVGFAVPPGVEAKVYAYRTSRTVLGVIPAKRAYISGEAEAPGRPLDLGAFNRLVAEWFDTRFAELPERRRVR